MDEVPAMDALEMQRAWPGLCGGWKVMARGRSCPCRGARRLVAQRWVTQGGHRSPSVSPGPFVPATCRARNVYWLRLGQERRWQDPSPAPGSLEMDGQMVPDTPVMGLLSGAVPLLGATGRQLGAASSTAHTELNPTAGGVGEQWVTSCGVCPHANPW